MKTNLYIHEYTLNWLLTNYLSNVGVLAKASQPHNSTHSIAHMKILPSLYFNLVEIADFQIIIKILPSLYFNLVEIADFQIIIKILPSLYFNLLEIADFQIIIKILPSLYFNLVEIADFQIIIKNTT